MKLATVLEEKQAPETQRQWSLTPADGWRGHSVSQRG